MMLRTGGRPWVDNVGAILRDGAPAGTDSDDATDPEAGGTVTVDATTALEEHKENIYRKYLIVRR